MFHTVGVWWRPQRCHISKQSFEWAVTWKFPDWERPPAEWHIPSLQASKEHLQLMPPDTKPQQKHSLSTLFFSKHVRSFGNTVHSSVCVLREQLFPGRNLHVHAQGWIEKRWAALGRPGSKAWIVMNLRRELVSCCKEKQLLWKETKSQALVNGPDVLSVSDQGVWYQVFTTAPPASAYDAKHLGSRQVFSTAAD